MKSIQIILFTIILALLIYYKCQYSEKENCINFGDYERCVLVPPDSMAINYESSNFHKIVLKRDCLEEMYKFFKQIDSSYWNKDTVNVYVVDLSNSSYYQFISLLDICVKRKVKQIVLNENMTCAYIFPDCKIKSSKNIFIACFYTINSNSIDFKLPAME